MPRGVVGRRLIAFLVSPVVLRLDKWNPNGKIPPNYLRAEQKISSRLSSIDLLCVPDVGGPCLSSNPCVRSGHASFLGPLKDRPGLSARRGDCGSRRVSRINPV